MALRIKYGWRIGRVEQCRWIDRICERDEAIARRSQPFQRAVDETWVGTVAPGVSGALPQNPYDISHRRSQGRCRFAKSGEQLTLARRAYPWDGCEADPGFQCGSVLVVRLVCFRGGHRLCRGGRNNAWRSGTPSHHGFLKMSLTLTCRLAFITNAYDNLLNTRNTSITPYCCSGNGTFRSPSATVPSERNRPSTWPTSTPSRVPRFRMTTDRG